MPSFGLYRGFGVLLLLLFLTNYPVDYGFFLQIHLQVEKTLIEISLKLSIFVLLIARLYSSTGVHYLLIVSLEIQYHRKR